MIMTNALENSDLAKQYTIGFKRQPGAINIDLSPNKFRGAFITLHSLSIVGLKCMEIDFRNVLNFNQNKALIKVS